MLFQKLTTPYIVKFRVTFTKHANSACNLLLVKVNYFFSDINNFSGFDYGLSL